MELAGSKGLTSLRHIAIRLRQPYFHRVTSDNRVALGCGNQEGFVGVIRTCKDCGRKNRVPGRHLADAGRCGACKAPLPPVSEPLEVDTEQFNEIIQNAPVPVLADFWAEWCGPCRAAAPEVARAAADMAGRAIVIKVDTERYPEVASRFNIRGIPYFAVFYQGRPLVQQAGLVNHQQLEDWLKSATRSSVA